VNLTDNQDKVKISTDQKILMPGNIDIPKFWSDKSENVHA
jgi:hypothetical protein